jgi:hypothetical protein
MSKQPDQPATFPEPDGWRPAAARVVINAVLVLLAYEVVSIGSAAVRIFTGPAIPVSPVELMALLVTFLLIRWIFVLPGLVAVLIGLEFITRRTAHARVMTVIVALAPMVIWELTKSPGDFPSEAGAVLGVTAIVFAVIARLPQRLPVRTPGGPAASQSPAEPVVGTR